MQGKPFDWTGHFYIFLALLSTIAAQLLLKWQVNFAGKLPGPLDEKFWFIVRLFMNPWVLLATFLSFTAGIWWMGALTRLELSYAYPFVSIGFVVILFMSAWMLHEPIGWNKLVGTGLIVFGLVVLMR